MEEERAMKAVVQSAFGSASEVLSVADVDRPSPGPAEILVRVQAAGLAKGNWLITNGLPYVARPSYGLRAPKHRVSGLAFAGRVEARGGEVRELAVGDAVFGVGAGALAEFVAVAPDAVALKPSTVSFEQAAAAPISGLTALQAVRDGGQVRPGQRVLVIGASGGVGSFAVQIAKAFGAEVTGVASTRSLAMVRALGADHVVDYSRRDPTDGRPGFDVVIDIAGNRPVSRLRHALAPEGTLVIVGGTGSRWTMGFERTIGAMMLAPFVRHRIVGLISKPNRDDLRALAELMAAGRLAPVVQRFPLSQAPDAIEALGSGHGSGSPVVAL
jgi:NADPH:quinone reductase-like Zn-dependent oxidoreductase